MPSQLRTTPQALHFSAFKHYIGGMQGDANEMRHFIDAGSATRN